MNRFFQIAIVGLLATTAACKKGGAAASATSYDTTAGRISLLHPEAQVVVGVNAANLLAAPLVKENAIVKDALAKLPVPCGIDPTTAIQEVLIGVSNVENSSPDISIVVTGLSLATVQSCAATPEAGGKVAIDGNYVTLGEGAEVQVAYYVNPSTMVTVRKGDASLDKAGLAALVAAHQGPQGTLAGLVSKAKFDASAWLIADGALTKSPDVVSFVGAAHVTDKLELALTGQFANDEAAKKAGSELDGAKGMAGAFATITSEQKASELNISVSMTKDQIATLTALMGLTSSAPPAGE